MKMKHALLLPALVLMGALPGCQRNENAPSTAPPPVVTGVTITPVAEETIPETIDVVGTVKARTSALLAARIAGTVALVKVKEGDLVQKGALIAVIDAVEPGAGAAGAAAGMELALRGVDEAKARKQLAEATFERYERLHKEEAVTRQEYETRVMEKEVARQGLAQAEAQLARARQESATAGAVAGYRKVTSPITGIVTAKTAEAGMTVFPGTPLVTVEERRDYRLELSVPESLSGKIHTGMTVPVSMAQAPSLTEARVVEIVPTVDPATRTFRVKVAVAADGIRSGMYGRARFAVAGGKGVAVPRTSILQRGSLAYIWVVDGNSIAHLRLVKEGRVLADRVELVAGLAAGERIVTGGMEKVAEGAKLQ